MVDKKNKIKKKEKEHVQVDVHKKEQKKHWFATLFRKDNTERQKMPSDKKKGISKKKEEKTDKEEKSKKKEELDIYSVFKKKEEKTQLTPAQQRRKLVEQFEKAGHTFTPKEALKRTFWITLMIIVLLTILFIGMAVYTFQSLLGLAIQIMVLWTSGVVFVFVLLWLFFMIYTDMKMFRRKLSIEEVLPDFLQLTSANIRAGMPIDKALWFAVRPRFGILAKEIEDVAKKTLSGENLHKALVDFAHKYDSAVLLRSVSLLNEGMEAGGDVGDLLNKIAINIHDLRSMKKEMSAKVVTYAIFITFASIIAAPALFGLSHELLNVVQAIAGDVSAATEGQALSVAGLSVNISNTNIRIEDYRIFAYVSLIATAFFSAIIVSIIRKGNIKEDIHLIPLFIVCSLLIFSLSSWLMSFVFSGLF